MILEYTNKIQDIGITLGVFLLHFLFFLFFPMVLRIPGVSLLTDNTLCMNFATLMIKLFSIDNKNSNLFLSFKVSKRGIFSLTFWNKIFLSHSNVLHWMTACISSPTVSSPFSLQKLQNRSDLSIDVHIFFFQYLGQDGLHGSAPVSPTCHLWHPTRMPMVLHKLEFVTSQDKCLLEPITILHVLKELPPEVVDLDQNKNPWNFKSSRLTFLGWI